MSTAQKDPKAMSVRRRTWRRLRGQAMVEYSVVTHAILIGGGGMLLPLIVKFYEGLSKFYDSVYFVLNSAAI